MAIAASRLADRYQLLRPLGTGRHGDVIAGRDVLLGRPVAVKVLHPEVAASPGFMARFAREVKAAARLSHPNVVAVYDLGEHDGLPFVVTELVEDRTLADLLRSGDGLPAAEPARIVGQVCAALAAAHAKGLVHGDLHPGNIMVGDQGRVKVADFGVGMATRDVEAPEQAELLAALYASPEEAKGEPVDARSDLYSLGVCLYECLVGEPPFTGADAAAVAASHAHLPPPPLRAERPDLPASLDAVMARVLAKDAGNRYQSADDLQEDLDLAVAGRPLRHAAAPPPEREHEPGQQAERPSRVRAALREQVGRHDQLSREERVAPAKVAAAMLPAEPPPAREPAMAAAAAGAGSSDRGPGQGPALLEPVPVLSPDSVIHIGSDDDEPHQRGRMATLVLAIPLLLVLLAGLALDQAGIGPFADRGGTSQATALIVPPLTGLRAEDASATLEGLGFEVEVVRRSHGEIGAGWVITTEPGPGSPVGPGQVIRLVISSGPTQNPVPSVVRKPGPAAKAELVAAGFPCELRPVRSDQPAGTVLAQEPPAGNRLPPGRKVVLTVSDPGKGTGGSGSSGGGSPGGGGVVVPSTTLPPDDGGGPGRDPDGGGRDPDGGPGPTSPPTSEPPPTTEPPAEPPPTDPPTEPTSPPPTAGEDENGRPTGRVVGASIGAVAVEVALPV